MSSPGSPLTRLEANDASELDKHGRDKKELKALGPMAEHFKDNVETLQKYQEGAMFFEQSVEDREAEHVANEKIEKIKADNKKAECRKRLGDAPKYVEDQKKRREEKEEELRELRANTAQDDTPEDDDEEENDDAMPNDLWAKHREAIMNTIVSPDEYNSDTIDTLLGQDEALKDLEMIIDQMKDPENYAKDTLPSNLVFYGDAGTGKGKMVKIMARETKCTLFKPPSRFFANNIDRLPALLAIAKEKATETGCPSIVCLDEADAILNNKNDAKIAAFKQTIENRKNLGNVIPILTTNHIELLQAEGLGSRTSNTIKFKPLSLEHKKELVTQTFESMHPPHAVDILDWEPLRELLTTGFDNRGLEEWCISVSRHVCYMAKKGKHDKKIRLEDCLDTTLGVRASTAFDDDALKPAVDEIKALCYSKEPYGRSGRDEPVVPVFESLLPLLSDEALDALGPAGVLRQALDRKKKDAITKDIQLKLARCLWLALPLSPVDNQADYKRTHIKRDEVYGNGKLVGYKSSEKVVKCKGLMIQKCDFYESLDPKARDKTRRDAEKMMDMTQQMQQYYAKKAASSSNGAASSSNGAASSSNAAGTTRKGMRVTDKPRKRCKVNMIIPECQLRPLQPEPQH